MEWWICPMNNYLCPCLILNLFAMKQKIITVSKRVVEFDDYDIDIDGVVKPYAEDGWIVKQIASTSFLHPAQGNSQPVIVITLLLERD